MDRASYTHTEPTAMETSVRSTSDVGDVLEELTAAERAT